MDMRKTKFKETGIPACRAKNGAGREEIPEDWEICPFSEVVTLNPYRKLKKGAVAKKVSMQNLQESRKKIAGYEIAKFKGGAKFKNKDTLMARITPCLENGKTSYVDILDKDEIGFGSTEFNVLCGKDGKTIDEFVYYLSRSPFVRAEVINSMVGTSGRQRVQNDIFDNLLISVPSVHEQKSIAKILSDLDSKIELNRKMNKTLEAIGQALFRRWFVDFEFPNEEGKPYKSSGGKMVESELGEIPQGWQIKSIDEIAVFLNGLALQKYPPKGEESLPVIKIRELKQGIRGSTDRADINLPPEYIVEDGDILFSWSGSLEICIWCFGKGALNQHLFKVTSKNYPKWFYYYWIHQHLPEYRHIAKGKATTMGHIQRHHLSSSMVLVPQEEVLSSMSKIMNPLVNKVINNKIESKELIEIRDSLLPRLMSGRIKVNLQS